MGETPQHWLVLAAMTTRMVWPLTVVLIGAGATAAWTITTRARARGSGGRRVLWLLAPWVATALIWLVGAAAWHSGEPRQLPRVASWLLLALLAAHVVFLAVVPRRLWTAGAGAAGKAATVLQATLHLPLAFLSAVVSANAISNVWW